MNKQVIKTFVEKEGEKLEYFLNKVLEPALFYFTNNQDQIKKNVKTFGIKPQEVKEGQDGIVFSKQENGNVIITVTVKVAHKSVFIQFLMRRGLTAERLGELIKTDKMKRFAPMFQYFQQALGLTAVVDAKQLLDLMQTMEAKEVTEEPKKVAVKKPKGQGKSEMKAVKQSECVCTSQEQKEGICEVPCSEKTPDNGE